MIQATVLCECQPGIKFHTDGAAERKAREPITVLIRETVRVPDSDDLKRRPETLA